MAIQGFTNVPPLRLKLVPGKKSGDMPGVHSNTGLTILENVARYETVLPPQLWKIEYFFQIFMAQTKHTATVENLREELWGIVEQCSKTESRLETQIRRLSLENLRLRACAEPDLLHKLKEFKDQSQLTHTSPHWDEIWSVCAKLMEETVRTLQDENEKLKQTAQELQAACGVRQIRDVQTIEDLQELKVCRIQIAAFEEFQAQTIDAERERKTSSITNRANLAAGGTFLITTVSLGVFSLLTLPLVRTLHERIRRAVPFGPTATEILLYQREYPNLSEYQVIEALLLRTIQEEGFDFPLPSADRIENYQKSHKDCPAAEALCRLVQCDLEQAIRNEEN